jgi:hypothetical protein
LNYAGVFGLEDVGGNKTCAIHFMQVDDIVEEVCIFNDSEFPAAFQPFVPADMRL